MDTHLISGNIVDLYGRRQYYGTLHIAGSTIKSIEEQGPVRKNAHYLMPGFVDAHVHVESSMLAPPQFARLAAVHGTVATVSDPHEIANVLGMQGVRYMIETGREVPFKFYFGAPSCVPATAFETAGAHLGPEEVAELLDMPEILYLAEMMNYPGVLHADTEVMAKIAAARQRGKPVDGHAPGLAGEEARRYVEAGISTDHECTSLEEARWKISCGQQILIREGSAARNFEALIPLMGEYPDQLMFCSDDKHPDDLIEGHINKLAARAVAKGYDLYHVLRAACLNPVRHYGLQVGVLKTGDSADFILVRDLKGFEVVQTWISGRLVAADGKSLIKCPEVASPNTFVAKPIEIAQLRLEGTGDKIRVITAIDGELVTGETWADPSLVEGCLCSDTDRDLLKMAVVNRYRDAEPALAFIRHFGLKKGALASSVAHDSHNIIAVGATDQALQEAINLVIRHRGGVAAVDGAGREMVLPLPIAGIMSPEDGYQVGRTYQRIDQFVKSDLGSSLRAPFMTLSFMALLVIPDLKLSDKGLFSGQKFEFVALQE